MLHPPDGYFSNQFGMTGKYLVRLYQTVKLAVYRPALIDGGGKYVKFHMFAKQMPVTHQLWLYQPHPHGYILPGIAR